MASAAEELNAQAQALKHAVGDLQQLVGGGEAKAGVSAGSVQPSKAPVQHGPESMQWQPKASVPTGANGAHGPAKSHKSNGTNGSRPAGVGHGNGRKPQLSAAAASAHNRQVIPLEDEFQDF